VGEVLDKGEDEICVGYVVHQHLETTTDITRRLSDSAAAARRTARFGSRRTARVGGRTLDVRRACGQLPPAISCGPHRQR
jgi:hypothetical protein